MTDMVPRPRSLLALACAVGLALTGCATGPAAGPAAASMAEMRPVTITVADIDPDGSVYNRAFKDFAEEVEQKSGGKIAFEAYNSGSLMPGNEMLAGIGRGTADMGRIITTYFPRELPAGNWFLGLGATYSKSYPHGLLQGTITGHRMHVEPGDLRTELESHNVVPLLSYSQAQQYDMLCTKPIDSLEDARGLRVRTSGQLYVREAEAIGMVAVPLPVSEMYEGLQRGIVDCTILQVPSHIDYSLWEVAKHYVPVALSQLNAMPVVINKDLWDSFPPDAKALLRESAEDLVTDSLDNVFENYTTFATEGPSEHHTVFHDPRPLDAPLAAHQQARVKAQLANPPAGIPDPEAFMAKVEQTNAEWLQVAESELSFPETERDPESIKQSFIQVGNLDFTGVWAAFKEASYGKNSD